MNQNERVKELRNVLGLTLEKFGEKLGVTKTAISRIEKGERNLTVQMAKSICREFNVDYIWLTTGKGQMFMDLETDVLDSIDRILAGENEFHKNLFKTFAQLSEEELVVLENILDKFIEVSKK